jgi:hypothetical protein
MSVAVFSASDSIHAAHTTRMSIGVVTSPADRHAVGLVRQAAFERAHEFRWKEPQTLAWSQADDKATVLGLWNQQGALAATVRVTLLPTVAAAQERIGYPLTALNLPEPLMLLTRAATHPQHQGHGGNALLRCAYLAAALQTEVQAVVTQVYDQAPRLRTLRHVGFELTALHHGWDHEAQARTQPLLAWMLRERFASGLRTAVADQASAWQEAAVDLRAIVASLRGQRETPGRSQVA